MKLYDALLAQKNSFLTRFGRNNWKKNARNYLPEESAVFSEILPLELKDHTRSSRSEQKKPCVNEVLKLIECLNSNDFDSTVCGKEALAAEKCHKNHLASKDEKRERRQMKKIPPYAKDLSHQQLNQLMANLPQNVKRTH